MVQAFWIEIPGVSHCPLGYGVTAWTLEDAFSIILGRGYSLPSDPMKMRIRENIRFEELSEYVKDHMGPIVVRGMWYPFYRLGV